MGRILALDYGQKRTGIAVTDPLQIIASPLTTIKTKMLIPFLNEYFEKEVVDCVVIGYPLNFDNTPTNNTERVDKFVARFTRIFPLITIVKVDEYGTSQAAKMSMIDAGIRKGQRSIKGNLDKISASLILQQYLEALH